MTPETKETLEAIFRGPNIKDIIEQSNKVHLINSQAVFLALIDKGVITPEEFQKYRLQATHLVDQLWQAKVDEHRIETEKQLKKLEEEFPFVGSVLANMVRKQKEDE